MSDLICGEIGNQSTELEECDSAAVREIKTAGQGSEREKLLGVELLGGHDEADVSKKRSTGLPTSRLPSDLRMRI
jgi:hypothetical protein